jgi:hypothetical protein
MKFIFATLLLALTACNLPASPTPLTLTTEPALTPSVTAESQSSELPSDMPQPAGEVAAARQPAYSLRVVFDYAAHNLSVEQSIDYTNNSADQLTDLLLIVEPERQRAGFTLQNLHMDRESGEPDASTGTLRIPFASPLAAGESVQIDLTYELTLPEGAGLLGWTERQSNLIDWYPYVAYYNDGWIAHEPAVVGEHGVYETANFDVRIEVKNAPASFTIAAPAPAQVEGSVWSYRLENARRFVWSASGHYRTVTAEQDGIPVTVYFYEEHRDAAEAALEVARQSLALYSELFGPYPYESLSMVESLFPDGMESDGLFFLDLNYFLTYNYTRQNYLTALTAHEVAHNWWFGKVGSDQATEPWLDEAFAIYSELLYYERFYPLLVDWWWNFRITNFAPVGAIDSSIYDHTGFSLYVHAVYMRGALFLRDLRAALGDDAFFTFLRAYSETYNGAVTSADELFALLAQHTNSDLTPIITEYFGAD